MGGQPGPEGHQPETWCEDHWYVLVGGKGGVSTGIIGFCFKCFSFCSVQCQKAD